MEYRRIKVNQVGHPGVSTNVEVHNCTSLFSFTNTTRCGTAMRAHKCDFWSEFKQNKIRMCQNISGH